MSGTSRVWGAWVTRQRGIRAVGRVRTTGMQQRRDRQFLRPRRVAALLAVGAAAVAGLAIAATTGEQVRSYPATIDATRAPGASAELEVSDDGAILVVAGLPEPHGTDQVWLMPEGADAPEPSVLFLPHHDGTAGVAVPGSLDDVAALFVNTEPVGGSFEPSSEPVLTASLS